MNITLIKLCSNVTWPSILKGRIIPPTENSTSDGKHIFPATTFHTELEDCDYEFGNTDDEYYLGNLIVFCLLYGLA